MADAPLTPDQTLAVAVVITANSTDPSGVATAGADTAGQLVVQVALAVQPDPANPTYLEQLRAAGL